jgi:predicted protein tyrosine phosphatase
MFEIKITDAMEAAVIHHKFTRIVSLVSPNGKYAGYNFGAKHHIEFFDDEVVNDTNDPYMVLPYPEAIKRVLEFTKSLTPHDRLLVHCHAGISRSTAMAMAILCQHGLPPEDACSHIFKIRPESDPNTLVLQLADEILGLHGELVETAIRLYQLQADAFWKLADDADEDYLDSLDNFLDFTR